MKNKIMLITYADSFGKNLKELKAALDKWFGKEIGAVHILPFFPSSGDRGFAPLTYEQVDPQFGDWEDIRALSEKYELMFDFMVNHLSRQSEEFQDYVKNHDSSAYRDMFIRFREFWPGGAPTQEQIDLLNKRKSQAPCEHITFADGTCEDIWCTFSSEQIDLNLERELTWEFIRRSLHFLMDHGASMIRLDAFAFATKKLGTSCFFVEPEMWEHMDQVQKILDEKHIPMLPEIHDHYKVQLKIAEKGYPIYDFALPVLVLHTLYTGSAARLKHWFSICPRDQYTTLDTHDGIGTVDVEDLLTEEELQNVIDRTEQYGANFKMDFSARAKDKPVVYQINCTYYSALGEDDDAYLLARAIQFFAPGVPQVYYMGLLAGENDYELMRRTDFPRNISRHNYTTEEIAEAVEKPVVQKLKKLMRMRNEYPAFDGETVVEDAPDEKLRIVRESGGCRAVLAADLKNRTFTVRCGDAQYNFENGQPQRGDNV
ncbi:MAG: sucrose phosphorylase [Lachnospiraceae bacterium]|nr:sucrose phosphorylase [Lachnospiraceae bacterium]